MCFSSNMDRMMVEKSMISTLPELLICIQTLAKEFAKNMVEETGLLSSSSVAISQPAKTSNNRFPSEPPTKEIKQEATGVSSSSPKASQTVVASTFTKTIVPRKTGKTGVLGAHKLTAKPEENLFEQNPGELVPVIHAASSTNNTSSSGSSFASRFEYFDEEQSGWQRGTHVLSHVPPPKSLNLFNDYGMDSAFLQAIKLKLIQSSSKESGTFKQSPRKRDEISLAA